MSRHPNSISTHDIRTYVLCTRGMLTSKRMNGCHALLDEKEPSPNPSLFSFCVFSYLLLRHQHNNYQPSYSFFRKTLPRIQIVTGGRSRHIIPPTFNSFHFISIQSKPIPAMMLHQHSSSSSSSSSRAAVLYPLAAVLLCGVFLETSSFVAQAFVPATNFHRPLQQSSFTTKQGQEEIMCRRVVSRLTSTEPSAVDEEEDENDDDEDDDDEDISFLFEEPPVPLDPIEQVWRYAKKPLLRIGSKGATHSHGNSLRQLLEDHTIVKVKVNTKKFQNSVQQAYEVLKGLAVENGASPDIELIQLREGTNEILFAMPGTLAKMEEGTFPPPPPVVEEDENGKDDDATTNEPSNELTA